MKLINPTDDELNAAFAEKVAGWKLNFAGPSAFGTNLNPYWEDEKGRAQFDGPWFVYSADAVLPWLEKHGPSIERLGFTGVWTIRLNDSQLLGEAADKSFPRAAVIALLRAHGVEVEVTDA